MANNHPKIRNGALVAKLALGATLALTLAYGLWYQSKSEPTSIVAGAFAVQQQWLDGTLEADPLIHPEIANSSFPFPDLTALGFELSMLQPAVINKRFGAQAGYISAKGCTVSLLFAHLLDVADQAPAFELIEQKLSANWKSGQWEYWMIGQKLQASTLKALSLAMAEKRLQAIEVVEC